MPESAKPFQLVAGTTALDLVNTLDNRFHENGPLELLSTYADVLQFVTETSLLSEGLSRRLKNAGSARQQQAAVQHVRQLREAVADLAYSLVKSQPAPPASLAIVEKLAREAGQHRQLTGKDGAISWAWHPVEGQAAAPLWLLAQDALDFLLSERLNALRTCANETCRWLFLDTSKNHTRRWCDMKLCGNRMKAKRFQERLRDA